MCYAFYWEGLRENFLSCQAVSLLAMAYVVTPLIHLRLAVYLAHVSIYSILSFLHYHLSTQSSNFLGKWMIYGRVEAVGNKTTSAQMKLTGVARLLVFDDLAD